ncbi:hypothetical protein DFJ73DRAFT_765705 [Zopfochytrium polystomum]|nr:hypothetical protein DFJ73DRAFT_765705 [Zopfochytrium polystomum]
MPGGRKKTPTGKERARRLELVAQVHIRHVRMNGLLEFPPVQPESISSVIHISNSIVVTPSARLLITGIVIMPSHYTQADHFKSNQMEGLLLLNNRTVVEAFGQFMNQKDRSLDVKKLMHERPGVTHNANVYIKVIRVSEFPFLKLDYDSQDAFIDAEVKSSVKSPDGTYNTKPVQEVVRSNLAPEHGTAEYLESLIEVMRAILHCKFGSDNPEIQEQLRDLGKGPISHINSDGDVFWGIQKGYGILLAERQAS